MSHRRDYSRRDRDRDRDRDDYGRKRKSYGEDGDEEEERRERKRHRREREEEARHKQIDFDKYRAKLAKIFFRTEDFIQYRSKEYTEFWQFLYKYQAVEKAKMERRKESCSSSSSVFPSDISSLGISPVYDKTLNLGFQLLPEDAKDLLNRISFQDYDYDEHILTEKIVKEFQFILTLYLELLQKEKFAKIKKLRAAQANLPIAEYKNEILEKLESHQIVIVAGDTGCGKSTQVPQYLLQGGYESIACTQPRRIACIALAKRVGYKNK